MDEPTLFPLSPTDDRAVQPEGVAPPRVQHPNGEQIEWRPLALDQLLPSDHRARVVWQFVKGLDLGVLYARIAAVTGEPGRPDTQALYRQRAAAAEWVHAQVTNRGFTRVFVRGRTKVKAVALLHALAVNLVQGLALRAAAPARAM